MTTWSIILMAAGAALVLAGTVAVTWLAATTLYADRLRRRAERAEEALARLRAQRRQLRQPADVEVLPGLFDEVDQTLVDASPTVLMGAITPYAELLLRELGRRSR